MNHMLYTQEISPSQKKHPTKNQTSCASCEIPTYINPSSCRTLTGGFVWHPVSAPGFMARWKLLPVVSEGPRIEDLILRSRISPAIGGLEADEKKTETQRRGGVEPSDLFT